MLIVVGFCSSGIVGIGCSSCHGYILVEVTNCDDLMAKVVGY